MVLDEVRIWNVARTQSQIQAAMNTELVGTETNLKVYYNFNQGIAGSTNTNRTTFTDRTRSGYDGTLSNFSLSGSTGNWVDSYAMVVPTSSAATSISSTGFTANWTAPAIGTITNYVLDVSTSSGFSSFVSGYNGLSVTGTSQAITGLSAGTTYYYRVRADKTSVTGQGTYSEVQTVTLANNLTVTYNSQGGSSISSGSTTSGGSIAGSISTSPGTPTRAGYTFNGWFAAATGGSAISFPYTHGQTANFTLYAQWTPPPTITSFTPSSGNPGALVTITGTDLGSPTAFTIGGATAIVVSNTGTS